MAKSKKVILFCTILFFICAFCFLGNRWNQMNKLQDFKQTYAQINSQIPKYEIANNQAYVRDGKLCMGYYVKVNPNISDNDLYKVFYHICNDGDYLHTIWFFSPKQNIYKSNYDVAMLEETDRSKWAKITKPQKAAA